MTKQEQWVEQVRRDCLEEASGDVVLAQQAVSYILLVQPTPPEVEEEWFAVPDSFLRPSNRPSVPLAVSPSQYPPEIVVNVASPIINVPQQAAPIINVAAPAVNVRVPRQETSKVEVKVNVPKQEVPTIKVEVPKQEVPVINIPKQEPPVVNVAAPTVNVAAPNVTVEAPKVTDEKRRKVSLKKDSAGNWSGEVVQ